MVQIEPFISLLKAIGYFDAGEIKRVLTVSAAYSTHAAFTHYS